MGAQRIAAKHQFGAAPVARLAVRGLQMASGVQSPASAGARTTIKSDLQFWFRVDSYCWIAFLAYWIVSGLNWKAAKLWESPLERMGQTVPMAAAYTLLFAEYSRDVALGARFVAAYEAFGIVGTIVTVAGAGLAIWARVLERDGEHSRGSRVDSTPGRIAGSVTLSIPGYCWSLRGRRSRWARCAARSHLALC